MLDHHRLGNPATTIPIPFVVDPVGSTATLVSEAWRSHGTDPSPGLCGILLAAILSDTMAFRSPTTTARDRATAGRLDALRERHGAALTLLLLTDPVRGASRLMACGESRLSARLPYHAAPDGLFDAGAVVSRKKQLIPAVLAALEG